MSDSGETTPPAPAAAPPPIPSGPAAATPYVPPPVPPYAAAAAAARAPQSAPPAQYAAPPDPSQAHYAAPPHPGQSQYAVPPHPAQAPAVPSGYPIPPGYPMPQGYAGPPGYGPPPGASQPGFSAHDHPTQPFAAPEGYAPPPQGYGPYTPPPQGYGPYTPPLSRRAAAGGSGLGVTALVLAVTAALGATVLGSIAAYYIGLGTGRELALRPMDIDFDWSMLTPVREWVLLGELAFWGGTAVGIWALVQGIIATVKNRGRGWGIAAIVIAIIGPIAFAIGVQAFLTAGFASGASLGA